MNRIEKIHRFFSIIVIALVTLLSPIVAIAGPGEDAKAVIDRWSAAYSANDVDAVVKNYRPDAILLGTVSPVISQGTDAIRTYFLRHKREWKQERDWRKTHNSA